MRYPREGEFAYEWLNLDWPIAPDGRRVPYDNYIERYKAQSDADRALADDLIAANPTFWKRLADEQKPKLKALDAWVRKNGRRELPPTPKAERMEYLQKRIPYLHRLKESPQIPAYEHERIDNWIAEAENELTEMEATV